MAIAHAAKRRQEANLQLDDPAAIPPVRLVLHVVNGDGSLASPKAAWAQFGAAGNGPLSSFQQSPFAISCTMDGTENIDPQAAAGGEVKIHVKEGQLYRLALYSAVLKTDARKFGAEILKDAI